MPRPGWSVFFTFLVSGKSVESVSRKSKTSKLPLILSLTIAVLLVGCYFAFAGFRTDVNDAFEVLTSGDQEKIREWVSQFGVWGAVVIIVSMVIQMFMFIVPNILLIVISILSYGPILGAVLAWFGIMLASTVGYLVGNRLSPMVVHRLVSPRTREKLKVFIGEYGMKAVIVLRLSTFSNDGLSIVAGLLNMRYKRFIAATAIGITPVITILAIFGRSGKIERGLLWAGGILVVSLIVYIITDMRRKKRGDKERTEENRARTGSAESPRA